MAPQILVSAPTRLTPAGKAYCMRARYVRRPHAKWADYHWLLLCRGARIRATALSFQLEVKTSTDGWFKMRGGLWIMDDGIYEVREEKNDPEKFAKPSPPSPPYYGGIPYPMAFWYPGGAHVSPPASDPETDDS